MRQQQLFLWLILAIKAVAPTDNADVLQNEELIRFFTFFMIIVRLKDEAINEEEKNYILIIYFHAKIIKLNLVLTIQPLKFGPQWIISIVISYS